MATRSAIDPLTQEITKFVVDYYMPRLVRFLRRNLSIRTVGWMVAAGMLVVIPFAVSAALRSRDQRASNKRYDTADYLSDDLA